MMYASMDFTGGNNPVTFMKVDKISLQISYFCQSDSKKYQMLRFVSDILYT